MRPAGIEPATFRFVTQHLNHCATAVPRKYKWACRKSHVGEVLALLCGYVTYIGIWLRKFQYSLSSCCSETSVIQQHKVSNNPYDRRPHLYSGGSPRCCIFKQEFRIIYTITLRNFVVPTCSVWSVILFRETGVIHRI